MIFHKKNILFIVCNLFVFNILAQNKGIEIDILSLVRPFKGNVGISVKNLKTNEQISVNGNDKFPMQSVYKFPLAIAVFNQIDQGRLELNQKMVLKKTDLLPDTHSPLREKYPNGKVDVSLKEILEKTVSESDNNGCDYLFRLMKGCQTVNNFIKKYQKTGINIIYTEEEMHRDTSFQYVNYATPIAMTALFEKIYTQKILSKKSTDELWKMLVNTSTAPNRLKGNLPKEAIIGHKSGWSGGDDRGFTNAINDTGLVILPDGTPFVITVFIRDTIEKSSKSDELAAKICKMVYNHFRKI